MTSTAWDSHLPFFPKTTAQTFLEAIDNWCHFPDPACAIISFDHTWPIFSWIWLKPKSEAGFGKAYEFNPCVCVGISGSEINS